jgi:chorismate mutase/prephenate dehydratase
LDFAPFSQHINEPVARFCVVNLPEHRKAIDKLDAQIVRLLNERTKHVLAIGEIKLKAGEEIYAPHRELAVFARVCKQNAGPITNESLRAIYREVMSSALSLEKSLSIAYLGPEATFTHQAAIKRFGASLNYAAQKTIADVFTEVSKSRADYGVVPVENSTEGVVTHTLDMFVDSDLKIVSQIVLKVQQCLMSNTPRKAIKKLYVHPQSLAQCRGWIQMHICRASRSSRRPPTPAPRSLRPKKRVRRPSAVAGSGEVWPGSFGAGHPGQRRQCDAFSRARSQVQSAHRQ